MNEAARMLVAAGNPLIIADRLARTAVGMERLIELAELLQAPVIGKLGRLNFPTDHYLNFTWGGPATVAQADVILGLEIQNFWGSVNRMRNGVKREAQAVASADARLIQRGEPVWFQLYPLADWPSTVALLKRVERAGAPVIVVAVDHVVGEKRETLERLIRMDKRDRTQCHGLEGYSLSLERRATFDNIDPREAFTGAERSDGLILTVLPLS